MQRTFLQALTRPVVVITQIRQAVCRLHPLKVIAKTANAAINSKFKSRAKNKHGSYLAKKSMKIRLNSSTFIRSAEDYCYIANIDNGKQITYNQDCSDFLSSLTYEDKTVNDILSELMSIYKDCDYDTLYSDYIEFIQILVDEGFVVFDDTTRGDTNKGEVKTLEQKIPQISDLTIELTSRCNENCIHCYLPKEKRVHGMYMNEKSVKDVIDQFAGMGGETITFTGGEVFVYPNLVRIINYANSKGLKVALYSNLIALSDKLLKDIANCDIYDVQVSLYGVDPEYHDSITQVAGSCIRTKNAIIKLVEAGLPVRIACPILRENRNGVWDVIKFCRTNKLQFDLELGINPRIDGSFDNLEHRLDIEEIEAFFIDLAKLDPEYAKKFLMKHKNCYDENFDFVEYLNQPLCPAGFSGLYITSTGDITVCPNMQGLTFGNISSVKLEDVWKGNNILRKFRCTTESSFKDCLNCEDSDYCIRCYARNLSECGNIFKFPDYNCKMARIAKNVLKNLK